MKMKYGYAFQYSVSPLCKELHLIELQLFIFTSVSHTSFKAAGWLGLPSSLFPPSPTYS